MVCRLLEAFGLSHSVAMSTLALGLPFVLSRMSMSVCPKCFSDILLSVYYIYVTWKAKVIKIGKPLQS
jgi:hypothetical protein